jgi:small subunit ribosomal protein S5
MKLTNLFIAPARNALVGISKQAAFSNCVQRTYATETRVIQIRNVKNMTKNGKIQSFSAMVVAGNGRGGIGVALGSDGNMADAVAKASRLAERNMEFFELCEGRTLFHDDKAKFKASRVFARSCPPGIDHLPRMHRIHLNLFTFYILQFDWTGLLLNIEYGRRCHWAIQEMCRVAGISDISAKVIGSRHPINVCRAFIEILRRQKTPQQVALDSGMNIVDVVKIYEHAASRRTKQNTYF